MPDEVICHLDDDRLSALQLQLVGDLAAGQAAADHCHCISDFHRARLAQEEIAGFDHLLVPLHRFQNAGNSTCRHDHRLISELLHCPDFIVAVDLNVKLCHLPAVPGEQIAKFSFVGLRGSSDKGAAELVRPLIDHRFMSPKRQDTCRFHSADASADDRDCLRVLRFFDMMLIPLHHLRVDRAAREVQGVAQILVVGHALVVGHVKASVVAKYARPDLVFPSL